MVICFKIKKGTLKVSLFLLISSLVIGGLMMLKQVESPETPVESVHEIVSSSSERTCTGKQCVQTIYVSPRYENYQGQWKSITDVIKMDFNYSTGDIKYSYGNDYYAIARLFFVVNVTQTICNAQDWNWNVAEGKCYLWWSQAKTFMESNGISYNVMITKDPTRYKYGLNLTNIPSAYADKVLYVGMRLEETSGNINWDDVALDNGNVVIKNKVVLTYGDLIDSGYTLNLYDKRTVLIGNVTNKNNLWLDPVTTIKANDTSAKSYKMCQDTSSSKDCSFLSGFSGTTEYLSAEYIGIGADDTNHVNLLLECGVYDTWAHVYNYTLPSYLTINWIFINHTGLVDDMNADGRWNYQKVFNYTKGNWNASASSSVYYSLYNDHYVNSANITSNFNNYVSPNNVFSTFSCLDNPNTGYNYVADYNYITVSYTSNTAPTYSNNISSYPSNYSPTNATQLNVTWNDDIDANGYNFSYIQIDSTNYTASRDGNKSYYSMVLGAGTHWWKAYANDSSNVWNSTNNVSFTIGNGTVPLTLSSNVTWTATYPSSSNVSGNGCPSPLTCNLYRNGTLVTGDNNILLGSSVYNYTWNTTGNANYTSNSTTQLLTINRGSSTLSVTGSNVTYPAAVNIAASESNSIDADCTYIFVRNGTVISSPDTSVLGAGMYNYTYNNSQCTNFTASSTTTWIQVSQGTPSIYSFSLNDTYINFNESILLSVNASLNAVVNATLQTSSGSVNYTLAYNGTGNGNYTYIFNKTHLGDTSANATKINITNIYTDGQNYTSTVNSSTLNFDYATSSLSVTHPSEVPLDTSITFTVKYNTTESGYIVKNCSIYVAATTHYFDYSVGLHTKTISTESWSPHGYDYSITCTNSSYQTQTKSGSFTVTGTRGAGDDGGGGGGGGYSPTQAVYAHLGEQCGNETACASGLTCENSICIATQTEFCGNGVCDVGETFLNCQQDCPSQSAVVAQAQFVVIALSLGYVLVMKPILEKKRKKRED